MLKISRDYRGFEVMVSEPGTGMRGYKVYAKDMTELHTALDHYYNHHGKHVNGEDDTCPFCRKMQAESKKSKR